jgi:hypothetical protein
MMEGMVRQAKRDYPQLDFGVLNDLVTAEILRLPADHVVQRWLRAESVREECEREVTEEVEAYLEEQVAAGRFERHPTDPERYRLVQFAGMPWD